MRLFGRKRRDVVPALLSLRADPKYRPVRSYIDDMILYAEVGRDRRKLDESYVARVRQTADELLERWA